MRLIARAALRRANRWSDKAILGGVPGRDLFPDECTRQEAVVRIDRSMEKGAEFWLEMILALAVWGAVCFGCAWVIENLIVKSGWVTAGMIAVSILGSVAAVLWTWRRVAARHLRRALIESGVPVCLRCGYPLRGLAPEVTPRCPECGWRVSRRVRSVMEAARGRASTPRAE